MTPTLVIPLFHKNCIQTHLLHSMSKFNYFFHILKSITGDVDDFADYFQYWVVKSTLMTLMTVFKPVLKNHMEHPTQQQ